MAWWILVAIAGWSKASAHNFSLHCHVGNQSSKKQRIFWGKQSSVMDQGSSAIMQVTTTDNSLDNLPTIYLVHIQSHLALWFVALLRARLLSVYPFLSDQICFSARIEWAEILVQAAAQRGMPRITHYIIIIVLLFFAFGEVWWKSLFSFKWAQTTLAS